MARSKRYMDLQRAVTNLWKALLPRKFDPTGTYRSVERVHLRTISFRILVHAEIESYIEDRAFELFDAGYKAWASDNIPNRVVLALLAYSGVMTRPPPGKLGGDPNSQKSYDHVGKPIQKAQAAWRAVHKDNHGIKESNIVALLLPLGIASEDIDTTLLADLTSFGGSRGAVAHRSSIGVTTYADPKSEHDQALQVVAALELVDELIAEALDELRKIRKAVKP